jgi:dihydrolipoamide dehydrogenase
MKRYNLIVIGGGPAGYTAAIRASKLHLSVALIEKTALGGTCLNRGCIPTKTLLHSSEIYEQRGEWQNLGIFSNSVNVDESTIYKRKDEIIQKLRDGINSLIKANKIDLISGIAELIKEDTVKINDEEISADNILIATGSSPLDLPIEGIEFAINSDRVLIDPVVGDNIIIIGGGVIGVEFASYLNAIGKQVTIIEAMDNIIPMMSRDLSVNLASILKKKGIKIITSSKVTSIKKMTGLIVNYNDDKGSKTLYGDTVIVSIGRKPNLEGLNLDKFGIKCNNKGIIVDENCYSGIGNIYAAGDVTGTIQLAHFAAAQGITAVESMLNLKKSINMSVVPSCIYTNPEIASVGITKPEFLNIETVSGKYMMGGNARSIINNQQRGYIKTIFEKSTGKIIGAEIMCDRATDVIGSLTEAVALGLNREQIGGIIYPHPTFMEGILESVEDSAGLATHILPKYYE